MYFWKARWDRTVQSLACHSRWLCGHPSQHTEAELKLICDMYHRNLSLGMVELWHQLRQRGYTRYLGSLFRVMCKLGLLSPGVKKNTYQLKPYEQKTYRQRVQVDVKVVPHKCITGPQLRLYQCTAIDEFTCLRFLAAYPEQSTYSSTTFSRGCSSGMHVGGSAYSAFKLTMALSSPIAFSIKGIIFLFCLNTATKLGIRHKLIRPYAPRCEWDPSCGGAYNSKCT